MMAELSLELFFVEILQSGRCRMIEDMLTANPDLYEALYDKIGTQKYNLQKEIYELHWLELHWQEIEERLQRVKISSEEKSIWLRKFTDVYREFLIEWGKKFPTRDFLISNVKALRIMLQQSDDWEHNSKIIKMKILEMNNLLEKEKSKLDLKGEI